MTKLLRIVRKDSKLHCHFEGGRVVVLPIELETSRVELFNALLGADKE